MSHHDTSTCENCSTALQGGYCHICGQRAHNPLRDIRHAVEEVFESLWHLDGRIFRTVRELFIPGRVAANYLAGHRVRYIAPLRLFVILTVLAFFVGKLTLHIPDGSDIIQTSASEPAGARTGAPAQADGAPTAFAGARTVDEVIAQRNKRVDELAWEARSGDGALFVGPLEDTIRTDLDGQARRRLAELGLDARAVDEALARAEAARTAASPAADAATAGKVDIDVGGEGFFGGWLKARGERLEKNLAIIREQPDEFVRLFLGAAPGALFLLVPVFALFLRMLYLRPARGYLEHLVVALYSHAFMLAAMLLVFLLVGLRSALGGTGWASATASGVMLAMLLWVPVYLLWMQKRVYGQGWLLTLLKYVILGGVYSILLGLALAYAALAGLTS